MNIYKIGGLTRLEVQVKNNDVLVDPVTVTITLEKPDGSKKLFGYPNGTQPDGNIIRDSVGVYHFDVAIDMIGVWHWHVATTGFQQAEDGLFVCDPSEALT